MIVDLNFLTHSFLNAYSGDGLVKELLEAFAFAGLALGVAPALVVGLLGDHTSPGAATREGLKVQPLQSRELPLVTSDNVIFLLTCRRMALLVPDKHKTFCRAKQKIQQLIILYPNSPRVLKEPLYSGPYNREVL